MMTRTGWKWGLLVRTRRGWNEVTSSISINKTEKSKKREVNSKTKSSTNTLPPNAPPLSKTPLPAGATLTDAAIDHGYEQCDIDSVEFDMADSTQASKPGSTFVAMSVCKPKVL